MAYALAEELTLTTYYPSPRGVYQELRVNGNVGIGAMKLHSTNENTVKLEKFTPGGNLALEIKDNDYAILNLASGSTLWQMYNTPSGRLGFSTDGGATEKMSLSGGQNEGMQIMVPAGSQWSDYLFRVGKSDGTWPLYVRGDGNVGLGTPNPVDKLHVVGDIVIQGTGGKCHLTLVNYPCANFGGGAVTIQTSNGLNLCMRNCGP